MSNRKWFWMLGGLVGLLVVGLAVWYANYSRRLVKDPFYPKASESVAPSPTRAPSSSASPTLDPRASITPLPQTTASHTNEAGTITVTSPTQGAIVTSGTTVSGTARVAVSKLYFRLKGGKSGQLASGVIATTPNSSAPVPFSFALPFTNQVFEGDDQGVLEVYTLNADGTEGSSADVAVEIRG